MIYIQTSKIYGQIDSLRIQIKDTSFQERKRIISDLENQTSRIIEKYVNVRARDIACKFITEDLLQLLNRRFEAGLLKGKNQGEALILRVGFGKTFKENTLMDIIVVEIGLAFEQPNNFIFVRILYPIKPNLKQPSNSPFPGNNYNSTEIKS